MENFVVSDNPYYEVINVEYELENVQSATILLISPYGGSTSHPLNLNHDNLSIDLSNFATRTVLRIYDL